MTDAVSDAATSVGGDGVSDGDGDGGSDDEDFPTGSTSFQPPKEVESVSFEVDKDGVDVAEESVVAKSEGEARRGEGEGEEDGESPRLLPRASPRSR